MLDSILELCKEYSLEYYEEKTIEWLNEIATTVEESYDIDRLDTAMDYNSAMRLAICTIREVLHKGKTKQVYEFIDNINKQLKDSYDYLEEIQEELLDNMEQSQKPKTPCDYPDYEGNYSCPYDSRGGDDCRNWCGLGVDE